MEERGTAIVPDPFTREGLIMAPRPHPGRQPDRGIWKHKASPHDPDVKTADFSYQNDDIAAMIVTAWTNAGFRDSLVGATVSIPTRIANARAALQNLNPPIDLICPIVLTEAEYDEGWDMDDPNQVVFVLPNGGRQSGDLLESAKLLMACVPNGI
jgi:hypothetical protein